VERDVKVHPWYHSSYPWWAWGYYTAALRGEVPKEVSTENVYLWIEKSPLWPRVKKALTRVCLKDGVEDALDTWKRKMATAVVKHLKAVGLAR